ncbi:Peptide transporter PTR3-B [Platanthera zijinensis]|uniref:Peptide transporter PTR3-B n=1 Tax=Platanthera zijinensis TaxID=2320716 RepID=A0AAP0BJD2_9ASPA
MADTENGGGREAKDYTEDGTVDIKGRPCLRSKGGRRLACYFIFVYGLFERLAYYGVALNLVLYLTNKLHQGTVKASNNVTNWFGTIMISPILGAYIADAHLGRYWTFIISSTIYLLGMVLLTLSVTLPLLRPPPCEPLSAEDCKIGGFHATIFFIALYTIALGAGGTKPNITTLGADQFDVHCPKERLQKLSFFNWWTFSVFFGNLFSSTVLVYIQDNVGFSVGYMISTAALAFSIGVFCIGTPIYRHKPPSGSPITLIGRVFVAAIRKWKVSLPDDSNELYENEPQHYSNKQNCKVKHSNLLRFFDKAAVRSNSDGSWMVCSVTEVEETKKIIKLLPVFIATIIPSMMMAQILTLFVKQGNTLDRSLGSHFQIPSGSLPAFSTLSVLLSVSLYDKCLVPLIKKHSKNPRGITMLKRIGTGQILHIAIMIVAAVVERRRLSVVRSHGLVHKTAATVPLSVFALLPQFALMGVAMTLVESGKMEFFYDQAPKGMKSVGASFFSTSLGLGNFISSFLLSTVEKATRKGGKGGWIENNLNASHLDYYYGFLAGICAINLVFFLLISKFYVYNKEIVEIEEEEEEDKEHKQKKVSL